MKDGIIYDLTRKSLDKMADNNETNLTAQIAGALGMIAVNLAFIGDALRDIAEQQKE